MEPITFFLIGFFVLAIGLGPVFGAESRPEFLRPDLRRGGPRLIDHLALARMRQRRSRS
jgi:hypothetical protein